MTQSRCRLGAALAYPCFALAAIILFAALAVGAEAASVPNPTVSGPIASPDIPGTPTHNYPFFASNHNLPSTGMSSRSSTSRAPPTATAPRHW